MLTWCVTQHLHLFQRRVLDCNWGTGPEYFSITTYWPNQLQSSQVNSTEVPGHLTPIICWDLGRVNRVMWYIGDGYNQWTSTLIAQVHDKGDEGNLKHLPLFVLNLCICRSSQVILMHPHSFHYNTEKQTFHIKVVYCNVPSSCPSLSLGECLHSLSYTVCVHMCLD